MPNPETVLVTIEGTAGPPSLESAAKQIGVQVADIDAQFGVVPIDLANKLYVVQVRADRLPKHFVKKQPYSGPFSEPRIEPFGPLDRSNTCKK
jgi:hypothetical protein